MRIVLFSLFGYEVYSHGVFLVLGIVIAGWMMYRLLYKENINSSNFLSNYLLSVILGIIASRVLFYLLNMNLYSSFYQIIEFWQGGLVSFSGFIVGALVFVLLLKKQKQDIAPYLNLAGITFPLGIAIGRIGCALNGEVGIKAKSVFAYYGYLPVTAFEIFICSVIFAINFTLYLKYKDKLSKSYLFFTFVLLYSLSRIIIDSWRIDPKIFLDLNYGQLVSIAIFVITALIYLKNRFNFSHTIENRR